MSLLLEALKKAERAKEEAQRKNGRQDEAVSHGELSLQGETPPAERRHVVTRSELPDIHQPLEILTEDIGPARRAPSDPKPASTASRSATAAEPPAAGKEQATARKVFEVKHREPNPRLPFFITLGVLGVAALGIVVYFWYQLQGPRLVVNPNPPASAVVSAPVQAAAAPQQSQAPQPAHTASSQQRNPLAGLPGLPTSITAKEAAQPKPAPPAPEKTAARGPKPSAIPVDARPARSSPTRSTAAASPRTEPQLTFARPVPQVHPLVDAAYAAYMSGDLAGARANYEAALREEPANRDALLGLAAVDVRQGQFQSAETTYFRLLQVNPRDAHAQAGLLGLRGGRIDPVAAESRVKNLLAADPSEHVLQFALGNQLAQQGRWAEAQQAYFRAYSADPAHPDFAFNLAVSLDHLRQSALARQYYERAVALSGRRVPSFDTEAARARIAQLAE